jgi:hypothetical protein
VASTASDRLPLWGRQWPQTVDRSGGKGKQPRTRSMLLGLAGD